MGGNTRIWTLFSVQRCGGVTIVDDSPSSLAGWKSDEFLSLFACSVELFDMMPTAPFHPQTSIPLVYTRAILVLYPADSEKLPTITLKMWNQLPIEVFQRDYKVGSFKKRVITFLHGLNCGCGVASVHMIRVPLTIRPAIFLLTALVI